MCIRERESEREVVCVFMRVKEDVLKSDPIVS